MGVPDERPTLGVDLVGRLHEHHLGRRIAAQHRPDLEDEALEHQFSRIRVLGHRWKPVDVRLDPEVHPDEDGIDAFSEVPERLDRNDVSLDGPDREVIEPRNRAGLHGLLGGSFSRRHPSAE